MRKILGMMLAFMMCAGAAAATVDKIQVPDTANVGGHQLVLNGAGLRTKFFVHVYVGALYLPTPLHTAGAVLAAQGPTRILMHMEYAASRSQMVDAFNDDFRNNLSKQEYAAVADRIKTFTSYFGDTHQGTEILIDYLPEIGTRVTIDGKVKGVIPGAEFQRAVLLVWLGKDPADSDLKEAMLAQ